MDHKGASKKIVAAGYDQVASRYAGLEAAGREWPRMRWLRGMLSRLPDGSNVLDVQFCRWLRPGGYLLFTIEPQDEPGVVGSWLGAPMFFSQFSADETLNLVKDAGFGVLRHAIEAQREGDRDVPYLWVLAQRQLSAAPHSPR